MKRRFCIAASKKSLPDKKKRAVILNRLTARFSVQSLGVNTYQT